MKFKLSRKRKKKYKKDVSKFYTKHFQKCAVVAIANKKTEEAIASCALSIVSPRRFECMAVMDKCHWEWFYFRRRVEIRGTEVALDNPTDEYLLIWYKKHYPEDKLAHHYCRQNRNKWDIFNETI